MESFSPYGDLKPGLGFLKCRIVRLVCLGSEAVLNATIGAFRGKGSDVQSMLRSILDTLNHGDLLLGVAFYATYFLLCSLRESGIDAVLEQHGSQRRTTDFRRGQHLGQHDHWIALPKIAEAFPIRTERAAATGASQGENL